MELSFVVRHQELASTDTMLSHLGYDDVARFIGDMVPAGILKEDALALPPALSEADCWAHIQALGDKNTQALNFIGQGYYGTSCLAVLIRNILENPAWYTAYTPYQAEIAQGRLEALWYFQTLITELTGLPLANASLLDEATAAAEAMILCYRAASQTQANTLVVVGEVFAQTCAVLEGRAAPLGLQVVYQEADAPLDPKSVFAVLVQYPDASGCVSDHQTLMRTCQELDIRSIVCADILSLALLKPPGEWGADVAVGSTQRLGIPMGYGGPHAAYLATQSQYKRLVPGRIIGLSKDADGKDALRMALQTREQHIKKERATSNICTSQALLAILAGFYGVYHGKEGLVRIAKQIHQHTQCLAEALTHLGLSPRHSSYFDTLSITSPDAQKLAAHAATHGINLHCQGHTLGISVDETHRLEDLQALISVLSEGLGKGKASPPPTPPAPVWTLPKQTQALDPNTLRQTDFMRQEVFHKYRTEHEMLRLLHRLVQQDFSLVHGMIPLGSCTMKLNATSELLALSLPSFMNIHPMAPADQCAGYTEMIQNLGRYLCAITELEAVSFQPNAGAQGEYAGLMAIRSYFAAQNQVRNLVLIPVSAHGTNPASATMAGYAVRFIACDAHGNVDQGDLEEVLKTQGKQVAALMLTYPSTHGVFESQVQAICKAVHQVGGQIYLDGANMNAQVGITSPGRIGADVCHLNLHKTFCIPHGGGGPGMGPIAVAKHLVPFLPSHPYKTASTDKPTVAPVSAAPYGSACLLLISYAFIRMMGPSGLRQATTRALIAANYIKKKLEKAYPILYSNDQGLVAHELILDAKAFRTHNITVEDIAKRLMDYGFHAPTVAFPVPHTLMIEPTESESLEEIERFCQAMLAIRAEIQQVEDGVYTKEDNPLKHAPHTAVCLAQEPWKYPYSRQIAAYPAPSLYVYKFWPSTRRIDNAWGDRNLQCACLPIASYMNSAEQDDQ